MWTVKWQADGQKKMFLSGNTCLSQPRVFSWAKSFREGRDRDEIEPHTLRLRTSVNPENVLKIGELIRANRRITVL
jgi:hypothetical protein